MGFENSNKEGENLSRPDMQCVLTHIVYNVTSRLTKKLEKIEKIRMGAHRRVNWLCHLWMDEYMLKESPKSTGNQF